MGRGRPVKSSVRNKIERILDFGKVMHGYEIYKVYKKAYGKTCLRNIYYNLKKGVAEGIFVEAGPEKVKGNYTWGNYTQRKNYILGPNASEKADEKVIGVIKKAGLGKKKISGLDWSGISASVWGGFEEKINNVKSSNEKKAIMEEYGRIVAWLGKKDKSKKRVKIERCLKKIVG